MDRMPEPVFSRMAIGTAVHAGCEAYALHRIAGERDGGDLWAETAIKEARKATLKAWGAEYVQAVRPHQDWYGNTRDPKGIVWDDDEEAEWVDDARQCCRDALAMLALWIEKVGDHDKAVGIEIPATAILTNGIELSGRIDRLVEVAVDGEAEPRQVVEEIKTSRKRWTEDQAAFNLQGMMYPAMRNAGTRPGYFRVVVLIRKPPTRPPHEAVRVDKKTGKETKYTTKQTRPVTEYELQRVPEEGMIVVGKRRQQEVIADANSETMLIATQQFPRRPSAFNCGDCAARAVCL